MIGQLLVITIGLAFFFADAVARQDIQRAIPEGDRSSSSFSGHSEKPEHTRELPMSWEDTILCARIFLGRLPAAMPGSGPDTSAKIALGRRLFFERGLSANHTQSCHDCHLLTKDRAGADLGATSTGAMGSSGKRNAPTVINAGFQDAQFWDGRARSLVEQAKGPILNPLEMAMRSGDEVVEQLRKLDGYEDAFARAFPGDADAVTYDHAAEAIAAFERTLVAPGRFDRLMDGRENALTGIEKRGLTKFIQFHCVECHSGVTVGGQLYKVLGQRHPYANNTDPGRYEITGNEKDRHVYKVPMLRNVTRTAPYFHDGHIFTLEEAVARMGWHQLGLRLTSRDIADLTAFLRTLDGDPVTRVKQP